MILYVYILVDFWVTSFPLIIKKATVNTIYKYLRDWRLLIVVPGMSSDIVVLQRNFTLRLCEDSC